MGARAKTSSSRKGQSGGTRRNRRQVANSRRGINKASTLVETATRHLYQGKLEDAASSAARALSILDGEVGVHPGDLANVLNTLADIRLQQGDTRDAGRLARRSIRLLNGVSNDKNAERVRLRAWVTLASVHSGQGEPVRAEPLMKRAVSRAEKLFGKESPEAAWALGHLALVYKELGRLSDAGLCYQRALDIAQSLYGPDHPEVATIYHNLAALEYAGFGFVRGEPFARRALRIRKKRLGGQHPLVASNMALLAALLAGQKEYSEADKFFRRALAVLRRIYGFNHPEVAAVLNNRAAMQEECGDHDEAERLFRRVLEIKKSTLGAHHPDYATSLNNLAVLEKNRGRLREAETHYRTALSIFEKTLGGDHGKVLATLENYSALLRLMKRNREAKILEIRADRIRRGLGTVSSEDTIATATINPMFACFRLSVRPSKIHRWGVFAEESIPAGRKVIEYTGERVSRKEARRRWVSHQLDYLFTLDAYWCVDGASGGSGAEYINHCCDPNIRVRILKGHILYMSKRSIRSGEELTVDYSFPKSSQPTPCRCGSPKCRGHMEVS